MATRTSKKKKELIIKTTTLHVYHNFWYILCGVSAQIQHETTACRVQTQLMQEPNKDHDYSYL